MKIEPIRNPQDLKRIRSALKAKPRDLLLFDLITQTGVGVRYLLRLQVKGLLGMKPGDKLAIQELKGKRPEAVVMNEVVFNTWQDYLNSIKPNDEEYVFKSRKGDSPLHISSVSNMIKNWYTAANLDGSRGVRRLQETWKLNNTEDLYNQNTPEAYGTSRSDTLFDPVDIPNRQDTVYKKLFDAIASGKILPGERIIAYSLAQQMNVSQGTVREALRRLEAIGLISFEEKQGIIVNELSTERLVEITQIRLMLESLAIERAVMTCSKETINQLRELHNQYTQSIKSKDTLHILQLNRQFHFTAYNASQMPILIQIIQVLWDRVSAYLHLLLDVTRYPVGKSINNHEKILEGFIKQDHRLVKKALRRDLIITEKELLPFLNGLSRCKL